MRLGQAKTPAAGASRYDGDVLVVVAYYSRNTLKMKLLLDHTKESMMILLRKLTTFFF